MRNKTEINDGNTLILMKSKTGHLRIFARIYLRGVQLIFANRIFSKKLALINLSEWGSFCENRSARKWILEKFIQIRWLNISFAMSLVYFFMTTKHNKRIDGVQQWYLRKYHKNFGRAYFTFFHYSIVNDPIRKNKQQKKKIEKFRKISRVNCPAHLRHKSTGIFSILSFFNSKWPNSKK